ncbi:MAG: DAK2 domain-containing protein [Lachnospirales bacterium]
MSSRVIDIDNSIFKNMIVAGANELEKNKEILNSLNVFPVPDGDTGTNMSLTFLAAAKELEKVTKDTVGESAKVVSSGALRGARGNSGVIVSQLFRGLASGLKGVDVAKVSDFAEAFRKSKETAYKAVMKPKEGTILTISSHIAKVATQIEDEVDSCEEFFEMIVKEGNKMLEKTQEMLPVLKQAGVVDSGAKGYMCILEGMLKGMKSGTTLVLEQGKDVAEGVTVGADFEQINPEDIEFGYCTEFFVLLEKENPEVEPTLKEQLSKIGDSIVVVADEDIVKIHVHTNNPGQALEHAVKFGQLDNLKIENMRMQHSNLSGGAFEKTGTKPKGEPKHIGFVSVSAGEGLSEILIDLGCDGVVSGGQSMNPSAEDICNVIDKVNADNVIILPNNSNIILAADQASKIVTDKNVYIVPTKTIPQGINCLINYLPEDNVEDVVENLRGYAKDIKSGAITHAVRDTVVEGIDIKEGDFLFMNEKKINNTSKDIVEGAVKLVEDMMDDDEAFVTLYYGEDTTEEVAKEIADALEGKYSEMEVDIQRGQQPIYYFLISVE